MNLEHIMLSEISQTYKNKYCIIPLKRDSQNMHIYRDRKQNRHYQGLGREGSWNFVLFSGYRAPVWNNENVFDRDYNEMIFIQNEKRFNANELSAYNG